MPTLLHIDSSPRGDRSVSRELTREFAALWKQKNPTGKVIYRDLGHAPVPFVDEAWVAAAFSPEGGPILDISDTLIAELQEADEYLFGVPMYNLSIPATFKAYIDQIVRVGKTFSIGEGGLEGLLKNKRATVVTSSGSVFREGTPYAAWNFQQPYLTAILAFLGITDVRFAVADGLNDVNFGKIDRAAYLLPIRARLAELAAA